MAPDPQRSHGRWLGAVMMGICVISVLAGLVFIRSTGIGAGSLPYLMVLLCPLMHLLMMRGHGGHQHHGSEGHERDENRR